MKKLVVVLIAVMIMFGSVSLAEKDMEYYYGTWVKISEITGTYDLFLIQLFKDNTAYYLVRDVENGQINEYTEELNTWEITEDGILLHLNNGRDRTFYDYVDGWMTDSKGMLPAYYHKTFPVTVPSAPKDKAEKDDDNEKEIPGNLSEGFLLDPGQYIVGEDIPEGDYRFEFYKASCDIYVHNDPESSLWNAFAMVTKNSPVYAKIHLPDGARVDILAPVIIMNAKKLVFGE